jgi:predicted RNA-binding Zn ribbon-like protein
MTFEFIGGNLALDFANTVHSFGSPDPGDDLQTNADLIDWGVQAGVIKGHERSRLLHKTEGDKTVLLRARQLRNMVFYLFVRVRVLGWPERTTINELNKYVSEVMPHARIARVGGQGQFQCDHEATPLERLHFEVVRSAIELLMSGNLDRVRECQGESCSWLFLDTSRNGKRRWCDMQACGNRAKVRRFRTQQSRSRTPVEE